MRKEDKGFLAKLNELDKRKADEALKKQKEKQQIINNRERERIKKEKQDAEKEFQIKKDIERILKYKEKLDNFLLPLFEVVKKSYIKSDDAIITSKLNPYFSEESWTRMITPKVKNGVYTEKGAHNSQSGKDLEKGVYREKVFSPASYTISLRWNFRSEKKTYEYRSDPDGYVPPGSRTVLYNYYDQINLTILIDYVDPSWGGLIKNAMIIDPLSEFGGTLSFIGSKKNPGNWIKKASLKDEDYQKKVEDAILLLLENPSTITNSKELY